MPKRRPKTAEQWEALLASENMPAVLGPGWNMRARGEAKPAATGRTAENMERARDLLWSGVLTDQELEVWDMYCRGASEAELAKKFRRSRAFMLQHYLGPLKSLCGIPTRPFPRRMRVNRNGHAQRATLLRFMRRFRAKHHRNPSSRELRRALGGISENGVFHHLRVLGISLREGKR